jgi:phosphoserine phosphatase|nr:hypothetical protein [Kofleriaceae bacterium]
MSDPTVEGKPADFHACAEELRALLAHERKAIVALDGERLAWLATQKQRAVDELERARRSEPLTPAHRDVIRALQLEARANAMLSAAASEAVRALLGRENAGYDRRARQVTTSGGRPLATY